MTVDAGNIGDPDRPDEGVRITDKRRIDPRTGAVRPEAMQPASAAASEEAGPVAAAEEPISMSATPVAPGTGVPTSTADPGAAGAGAAGAAGPGSTAGPGAAGAAEEDPRIAELTSDLQRITAEYANYRKRVDRDREAMIELATASALAELLPMLDDIDRARSHDELRDGFKAVAESLEAAVAKLGLERFGQVGDPFDPKIHEALVHSEGEGLAEPTCTEIYQPGYRLKGRVVRPARVVVKE